jgi:hypothetical protein
MIVIIAQLGDFPPNPGGGKDSGYPAGKDRKWGTHKLGNQACFSFTNHWTPLNKDGIYSQHPTSDMIRGEDIADSIAQNIAPLPHTTKTYTLLEKAYVAHLNPEQRKLFEIQKKQKILDRFDLTILLHHTLQTRGTFSREQVYYEERKNGTYQKKKGSFPVTYNLMIIDEFQNYLPEQLRLIKKTLNPRLKSIVYVGDLAQQTQLGTVRDLQSIDETVKPERLIQLQKVYRNTRQILSFIKNLGYNVFIPDGVKEGKAVVEITNVSITEEVAYVREASNGSRSRSTSASGATSSSPSFPSRRSATRSSCTTPRSRPPRT